MSTHRGRLDFVGHQRLKVDHVSPKSMPPIDNFIYQAQGQEDQWIQESTEKIGEWRAIFRSTYIAWAISINGLFAAEKRYSDPDWASSNAFQVQALRPGAGPTGQGVIAEWPGHKADEAHVSVAPILCAYGFIDLYGALEEFVFDMYTTYLDHNPETLIRGSDFRELRQLKRQAQEDPARQSEWEEKWSERLEAWHMKKLYDGLDRVFLAYCTLADFRKPAHYKHSDPNTWSESIGGFALLRNCIAHGVRTVSPELAQFSALPHSATFDFAEGEDLEVKLHHLQSIELFTDQILNALNLSLLQRAGLPLPGAV